MSLFIINLQSPLSNVWILCLFTQGFMDLFATWITACCSESKCALPCGALRAGCAYVHNNDGAARCWTAPTAAGTELLSAFLMQICSQNYSISGLRLNTWCLSMSHIMSKSLGWPELFPYELIKIKLSFHKQDWKTRDMFSVPSICLVDVPSEQHVLVIPCCFSATSEKQTRSSSMEKNGCLWCVNEAPLG